MVNALRDDLKNTFLAPEHLAERSLTLRDGTLALKLPLKYEAFQALINEHQLNPEEINAVKQVYYKNIYHTAWRYIAKPNRWMAEDAFFVNDVRTERWSTFEEYQSFIAYLYCAAKDENAPPIEKGMSIRDRVTLFMRALALINRQHNWDKYRDKCDNEGRPLLDPKGNPIKEQYDDGRGDCHSCFSGVKRNLFQSLIGHPLYTPLNNNVVEQFIKEEIRAHYVEILNECSFQDLADIKEAIDSCIFEAEEAPILKNLRWEGKKIIQEKMQNIFKERGVPYYYLIEQTLYPDKKENTFISYFSSLGFDQLLDKLMQEKGSAPTIRS